MGLIIEEGLESLNSGFEFVCFCVCDKVGDFGQGFEIFRFAPIEICFKPFCRADLSANLAYEVCNGAVRRL